jgi:hypothetical protein
MNKTIAATAAFFICTTLSVQSAPMKRSGGQAKVLQGHVNILDAAFEEAGIKLDKDSLPSTIRKVKPGSAADSANIGEGDQVLSAFMEKQDLVLSISRNGKVYSAKIDLSADGLVKESGQTQGTKQSAAASNLPHAASKMPYAAVTITYSDNARDYWKPRGSDNGWNDQAVNEDHVWELEYHHGGQDLRLYGSWLQDIDSADQFLKLWMHAHWPRTLYTGHQYHLAVERNGHVKAFYPMDDQHCFGSKADCDKYAYQAIHALSDSRILAFPPTSQTTTLHIGLIFRNTRSGEWVGP